MAQNITEEQKQQLVATTMDCGRNAWEYAQSKSTEERPWIIVGILSCIKKGLSLNRLTVNWEARELRYANAADCAQLPILTEKQQQLLQQTALTDGKNAWAWVQSQRKEDQPWAAAGVLSCIEKGYDLNEAMICWEAREFRYEGQKTEI